MDDYVKKVIVTESPVTPAMEARLAEMARPIHAISGIVTEAGELWDPFKRHIFYNKPIDRINLKEEIGDLLWYVGILCDWAGLTIQDCMEANIAKLATRYPEKFSEHHAVNRDLTAERNVLER